MQIKKRVECTAINKIKILMTKRSLSFEIDYECYKIWLCNILKLKPSTLKIQALNENIATYLVNETIK